MKTEQEIYQAAIDKWGYEHQEFKLIEEFTEALDAVIKYRKNRSTANLEHLHEEIADVEIMIAQFRLIARNNTEVNWWKEQKLARLKRLINIGTYQYSTKQEPDLWKDATDEEYETGKHLERYQWRVKP